MKTVILYSEKMRGYGFAPEPKYRGRKCDDFIRLFEEEIGENDFKVIEPREASTNYLALVHDIPFIYGVRLRAELGPEECVKRGLPVVEDTPLRQGIYEAARLVVGASIQATELVWEGKFNYAVGLGGGLQHATRNSEGGFCVFNDIAIDIRDLEHNYGANRILNLSVDLHANNGTAEILQEDPKSLKISIHRDPTDFYPHWGFVNQIGAKEGEGYTVNVPLPYRTSDLAYEHVLDEIFVPLAEEFKPEIIIVNGGPDAHFADEYQQLALTFDGYRMIGKKVREVANKVCNDKVVYLPGSGYNAIVFPYATLSFLCGLTGIDKKFEEPILLPKWLREIYDLKEELYLQPPEWLRKDNRFEEVKDVVKEVKRNLKGCWKCFQ
ncbi:MAG: histone deacetylase [Candidatus Aenigmarchaeota archaeon]|nr:histone deacetylase [Candidatus Aenigmarchaeota archaeon]